jgi:hypothetical protein
VRWIRKLLQPILKLFFNPNPLVQALHIQAELNTRNAERENLDILRYEVMHNLVLETTRLGIEVKNLKMRVESMSSRLDFDERRARALEGVVQYRPGAVPPLQPPRAGGGGGGAAGGGAPGDTSPGTEAEQAERRNRRRRRRGRRRPGEGREGTAPGSSEDSTRQGHVEAGSDQAAFAPQDEGSERASAGARTGYDGATSHGGDAHGSAPADVRETVQAGSDQASPEPPADGPRRGGGSHES